MILVHQLIAYIRLLLVASFDTHFVKNTSSVSASVNFLIILVHQLIAYTCRVVWHTFHKEYFFRFSMLRLLLAFVLPFDRSLLVACFSLVQFLSNCLCSRSTLVKSFAHLWIFKIMFVSYHQNPPKSSPICDLSLSYFFELVILFNVYLFFYDIM